MVERLTYEKSRSVWDRGKYPTKYTSRHTFQEVVARLAAYEDTGLEPEGIIDLQRAWDMYGGEEGTTALLAPPNDPLTLEQLREMDGEPVWCINGNNGQWGLVHVFSAEGETYVECVTKTGFTMDKMTYGAMGIYAWLAYRRKPEEGTP